MKRFILVLVLIGAFITADAQPRAIGGRFGGDAEFSYQHGFGSTNMLDCTIGAYGYAFRRIGIQAIVVYDWIFNIEGGFNFYVGPGGGAGFNFIRRAPVVHIGGQVGVEYQFGIPLNLSFDYRPMFNALGFLDHEWGSWVNLSGFAFGARYRF